MRRETPSPSPSLQVRPPLAISLIERPRASPLADMVLAAMKYKVHSAAFKKFCKSDTMDTFLHACIEYFAVYFEARKIEEDEAASAEKRRDALASGLEPDHSPTGGASSGAGASKLLLEKEMEQRARRRDIALVYASILLTHSNYANTQQERAFFESLYDFSKRVLFSINNRKHWHDIEDELDRVFRSQYFNRRPRTVPLAKPNWPEPRPNITLTPTPRTANTAVRCRRRTHRCATPCAARRAPCRVLPKCPVWRSMARTRWRRSCRRRRAPSAPLSAERTSDAHARTQARELAPRVTLPTECAATGRSIILLLRAVRCAEGRVQRSQLSAHALSRACMLLVYERCRRVLSSVHAARSSERTGARAEGATPDRARARAAEPPTRAPTRGSDAHRDVQHGRQVRFCKRKQPFKCPTTRRVRQ